LRERYQKSIVQKRKRKKKKEHTNQILGARNNKGSEAKKRLEIPNKEASSIEEGIP
jgi:hypothetical protein